MKRKKKSGHWTDGSHCDAFAWIHIPWFLDGVDQRLHERKCGPTAAFGSRFGAFFAVWLEGSSSHWLSETLSESNINWNNETKSGIDMWAYFTKSLELWSWAARCRPRASLSRLSFWTLLGQNTRAWAPKATPMHLVNEAFLQPIWHLLSALSFRVSYNANKSRLEQTQMWNHTLSPFFALGWSIGWARRYHVNAARQESCFLRLLREENLPPSKVFRCLLPHYLWTRCLDFEGSASRIVCSEQQIQTERKTSKHAHGQNLPMKPIRFALI